MMDMIQFKQTIEQMWEATGGIINMLKVFRALQFYPRDVLINGSAVVKCIGGQKIKPKEDLVDFVLKMLQP